MTLTLPLIDNRTILTPTGGYLEGGFTHSINLSQGCSYAGALCGIYCYAQHSPWISRGRPWGLYGWKKNIRDAYRRDYDQLKRPRRGEARPLRIYMSPMSDPYQPQEASLELTRSLLEEMQVRPPDVLVIQTRSPLVRRDLDLIVPLSKRCTLWLSMTVETDMDRVPGLPPHATPIQKRIETLRVFREAGVGAQGAVSPLLPLANPETFARELGAVSDRVVIDHWLIGDGSKNGSRTRRTAFPALLEEAGLGKWNTLARFQEVVGIFERILGAERVRISTLGFNDVETKAQ
jgi:DNA repair photolyase